MGDSRLYRLRGSELRQLTADHSFAAEMLRLGTISLEQFARHPYRNVLTRVLGTRDEVEVDVMLIGLHAGDRLLLCSDGVSHLPEAELSWELGRFQSPVLAAHELVERAVLSDGSDNATAVVVDVDGYRAALDTWPDEDTKPDALAPGFDDAEPLALVG